MIQEGKKGRPEEKRIRKRIAKKKSKGDAGRQDKWHPLCSSVAGKKGGKEGGTLHGRSGAAPFYLAAKLEKEKEVLSEKAVQGGTPS